MEIDLPPRVERVILDAVNTGRHHSVEDVLTEAVALWQTQNAAAIQAGEKRSEAIERLKTFGKRHGLSLGGMTIRELRDERVREGIGPRMNTNEHE